MTTNKKRIAIAPTYIKMKINEINSHFNKNKRQEEDKKLITKNKTEYTVFCTVITITELNNKILENM